MVHVKLKLFLSHKFNNFAVNLPQILERMRIYPKTFSLTNFPFKKFAKLGIL